MHILAIAIRSHAFGFSDFLALTHIFTSSYSVYNILLCILSTSMQYFPDHEHYR